MTNLMIWIYCNPMVSPLLKNVISVIVVIAITVACASPGTVIVTGTKREPIPVEQVRVYHDAPNTYEVIGIVKSHADSGWTQQGAVNYAVLALRKQAAKIGANGVILTSASSGGSDQVGFLSTGQTLFMFDGGEKFQGTAIFVADSEEPSDLPVTQSVQP